MCTDFQLVTSVYRIFEANSTPSNQSNTPYGIVDSKPEVIIGESAKHDLKVIFNSHVNFMAALLNGFTDSQDKEHAEFKEELKKVFEESEETERKKLSKFHRDLDETLSNAGIWFSARIFYLMLGIFLPCFAFTVFMLAWFIARQICNCFDRIAQQ